jgi:hypothetical protein
MFDHARPDLDQALAERRELAAGERVPLLPGRHRPKETPAARATLRLASNGVQLSVPAMGSKETAGKILKFITKPQ